MKCVFLRKTSIYQATVFVALLYIFTIWFFCTIIINRASRNLEATCPKVCVPNMNFSQITKPQILPRPQTVDIMQRPGHMGKKVTYPLDLPLNVKKLIRLDYKRNGFNQYASDLIGIRRTLPDPRDEWCKDPDRFRKDLPSTSVIIPFYNEPWSTLLRTVNSVLDNSPSELIHEIILVDDYSSLAHLKIQLEEHFLSEPKVKIVRTEKREGLTRTKILGAKVATGEVLTYLDSHCECTTGWLEPLLDSIARNSTTVSLPSTENIRNDTFEYEPVLAKNMQVIIFNWHLHFINTNIPERELKRRSHPAEPAFSPVMYGGLFSISRAFFEKLGYYDSGLDIWGGENLELSWKVWMCGGNLQVIPCSHVGHVFRNHSPFEFGEHTIQKNIGRVATVWMDEYAQFYFETGTTTVDFGDLSSRIALRKSLNCKSFRWYLKNAFPELIVPTDCLARGAFENLGSKLCLDSMGSKSHPAGMYTCHGMKGNQYFWLTRDGEIRQDDYCFDFTGEGFYLYRCHGMKGNQLWHYLEKTMLLKHGVVEKCLAVGKKEPTLELLECDFGDSYQQWSLENFKSNETDVRAQDDLG